MAVKMTETTPTPTEMVMHSLRRDGDPWVAIGTISEETLLDKNVIRPILKELVEKGEVEKIGNKRSTRYALAGSEAPEAKNDVVSEQDILDLLSNNPGKSMSRQEMCKELKTYDIKLKGNLFKLIDDGKVAFNGKKKGQLFWLATDADAKPVEEKPKTVDVPTEVIEEESEKVFHSVEELIRHACMVITPGRKFEVVELAYEIMKHGKHEFTPLQVMSTHRKMMKKGLSPVKYEQVRDDFGNRFVYYIER